MHGQQQPAGSSSGQQQQLAGVLPAFAGARRPGRLTPPLVLLLLLLQHHFFCVLPLSSPAACAAQVKWLVDGSCPDSDVPFKSVAKIQPSFQPGESVYRATLSFTEEEAKARCRAARAAAAEQT